MSFVDLAYGGNQAIQQLLLQRELEKAGVSPIQLAQAKLANEQRIQSRADQEMLLRQQEHQDNVARQAALDKSLEDQRLSGEAGKLADALPPGAFLRTQNPAVGTMQQGGYGSLLQPSEQDSGLPAMGEAFQGPMQTGELPQEAQSGKYQGFLKTASQKQIDTNTDNARQQAALESAAADRAAARQDREASQASLDAYRQAMLQRQPQGRMSFEEWKQRQDYAAGLKKEAPAKLSTRDNDTVVTIHQMMPRINEVVGELQKNVANQPAPKPGLLGAVSQLGQKAERVGQSAAYKMGLAQPADISNRIQLESLMQVLGTVPYLRGTRNYQFIQQIQQHLADPTATDAANLERLKQLQRILPEMEQAIYDVENQGVIPHEHGAGYTGGTPAPTSGFSVREIK